MKKSNLLTQVIAELEAREAKGIETYGTTLDRTDLTRSEWLQHAYEEALDLALYLKKLKIEEDAKHKEEMIAFAEFVAKYPDKNRNANNEMLHAKSKYDGAETTVDLLDEFYIQNFKEYARKQN
jgi:hypothetical protein